MGTVGFIVRGRTGMFLGIAIVTAAGLSHGIFPDFVFTDSAGAYENVWHSQVKGWKPEVIRKAGIRKPHANNNRIERLNGTLRERVKVQRGWKTIETPLAEGQRIHYNFVKPHLALAGMTPAQRAGITINSKNKWLSLLQKSMSGESAQKPLY